MIKRGKVLVTGAAGFIGMHVVKQLVLDKYLVVGIDNLNTYYSVELKLARLKEMGVDPNKVEYNRVLEGVENYEFLQLDISDEKKIDELFESKKFDFVIHLAAQAGVRYSIENPQAYIRSNVQGFLTILEASTKFEIGHLVFASSSSVYGTNEIVPFTEEVRTDKQVSLYAATKKANEAMAHSYSSVHKLKITGLRFFTVYGPWGRPDMALFKFTKKILEGHAIDVYNSGNLSRDFTYIDDIVDGIIQLIKKSPSCDTPYSIFNIGNGKPVNLLEFIHCLEEELCLKADLNMLPMQQGDVERTWADISKLLNYTGYNPKIEITEGVKRFVNWYKGHYS